MSPVAPADQELEIVIRELAMRIVVPRRGEFDDLWESANRVRDRYGIEKSAEKAT